MRIVGIEQGAGGQPEGNVERVVEEGGEPEADVVEAGDDLGDVVELVVRELFGNSINFKNIKKNLTKIFTTLRLKWT